MSAYNNTKTEPKIEISTRTINPFDCDNGFTMIDNSILDYLKQMSQTPSAFLVLMTIIRLTLGWNKLSAQISYETLKVSSGIASDTTIAKAIQYWEWLGVIEIKRFKCRGRSNIYTINTQFELFVSDYFEVEASDYPPLAAPDPIEPKLPIEEIKPVEAIVVETPAPVAFEEVTSKIEDYSSQNEDIKRHSIKLNDEINIITDFSNENTLQKITNKLQNETAKRFLTNAIILIENANEIIVKVGSIAEKTWLDNRFRAEIERVLFEIDDQMVINFTC